MLPITVPLPAQARQELSATGTRRALAVHDDLLTSREDTLRPGAQFHAFVRGVVHIVMQPAVGECELCLRIPDHEIGVRTGADGALARIESIELRGRRGCERNEAVHVEPSRQHAFGHEQGHACLDAGHAVRYRAEMRVWTSDALAPVAAEAERRMVRGEYLEHAGLQAAPDVLLVRDGARRWAADAFRTLE